MTVQVVRPAGAGHETLYVLLLCLVIVLAAACVVAWHGETESETRIESHQIDARRDLTAAEQGLYADLRVAADEIRIRFAEEQALLTPAELAEEGFPPFTADASTTSRGSHQWQLLPGDGPAYFGASQALEVAGSLLMLLDTAHEQADVWLNRKGASAPDKLDAQSLITAGWQQIASQYDAGVTRQHRH
ncbi:DUF6162 family protein [Phytopseudomonas punonensis]|uniref:Periplasmic protein n=1 Tax=Phytopseudomonas punonensis TaxID=1220495 RepID=A0A1M7P026_9GAMM|nr:DUF6162 family protein [Pseudomonas punonensis]SHN09463.1 hypothetical protein SAMN05216288_0552 [Pseudomonas punonensis]